MVIRIKKTKKTTKIRTSPVLPSYPKQGLVFTVYVALCDLMFNVY